MKKYLQQVEGFTLEEYDDGTSVLLNSDSGIVHILNTIATLLYKLCEEKLDEDDLFNVFLTKLDLTDCEVSLEEIRSDYEFIINKFVPSGHCFSRIMGSKQAYCSANSVFFSGKEETEFHTRLVYDCVCHKIIPYICYV